jgi:DNA (cytosine-5)-methyltransferase 1
VGYHRAGFDVVGVDHNPQPRYPFRFVQADAMAVAEKMAGGERWNIFRSSDFAAIHASPPCQAFTVARHIHQSGHRHPDLVGVTRDLLMRSSKPWVIENTQGAPLDKPSRLCGLMFGLRVLRHRWFECSFLLMTPTHPKHPKHLTTGTLTARRGGRGNGYSRGDQGLVCVAGNNFVREAGAKAMGIDWMKTRHELTQAIPPAYTEFVGRQLIEVLTP